MFNRVQGRTPALQSKLPAVGTTIFTVMSQLAAEKGAVNLGQGFPDFHCDPKLVDAVTHAMQAGHNQYPPMAGLPVLERLSHSILLRALSMHLPRAAMRLRLLRPVQPGLM